MRPASALACEGSGCHPKEEKKKERKGGRKKERKKERKA